MAAPKCSQCWDSGCPRSRLATAECWKKFITDLTGNVQGDGTISGLARLNPLGLDLRQNQVYGFLGPGVVGAEDTLTVLEHNFDDATKIGTAAPANLAQLNGVFMKRKGLRRVILTRVGEMLVAEADAAMAMRIDRMAQMMSRFESNLLVGAGVGDGAPRSQQEFLERQNPRLALFNAAGKAVQKHGLTNLVTVEQSFFDPVTGKAMQKVEHQIHFKDVLELYRTWDVFCSILMRLGFGSYGGWDKITAEVYTALTVHGVSVGHKFVTEILNALDTKMAADPMELLTTGKAYMYLNSILSSRDSSAGDPSSGKSKGKKALSQVKRGPVTKQKEFASLVKDDNGKPRVCYNFNNGTPCMFGVGDPKFPNDKGKCAFHHACEVCGEDHPKVGNHP